MYVHCTYSACWEGVEYTRGGGYLSLMKYIAFIDSLLLTFENSNFCSALYRGNVSHLGYADDVASASTSKAQTDQVLKIVYNHSCKWRYRFNPKKSAVLVLGEGERENKVNSKYRTYRLGSDIIKEATSYDHLGLKEKSVWASRRNVLLKKLAKAKRH